MTASEPDEIYPNAPLGQAIFEIRFPGEPAVECQRDGFYEIVRKEFPSVRVPMAGPGDAIALKPYEFRSADEKKWLSMSINRFAFSRLEYQGYQGFAEEAMNYVAQFVKRFHISTISRTGLRYINTILFTREDGLLPLERYFKLTIGLPSIIPSSFSELNLRIDVPTDTGSLTIRLEPVISPDRTREAFVLDFDYRKTRDLTPENLRQYVDESHDHIKSVFEGIITDEFRQVMRGEVIE